MSSLLQKYRRLEELEEEPKVGPDPRSSLLELLAVYNKVCNDIRESKITETRSVRPIVRTYNIRMDELD